MASAGPSHDAATRMTYLRGAVGPPHRACYSHCTMLRISFLLSALFLLAACASTDPDRTLTSPDQNSPTASPATAVEADPGAVEEAIRQARQGGTPFHLRVHCADDQGIRAFDLFPSGVAIWNQGTQVRVPPEVRDGLLQALLDQGFPSFADNYGGKPPTATPQPADGAPSAPLTVSCRIRFESQGAVKSSVQQIYGEQSAALTGLAAGLLDLVEPMAANGTTAADLDDGLAKLASGDLAPETFELRFVSLPTGPDSRAAPASGTGTILRVVEGHLSRQPYTPGREIGEPRTENLDRAAFERLVDALRVADFDALPTNLFADDQIELEVRVLGHRKAVLARPFAGLARESADAAGERFATLAALLHDLGGAR